MSSIFSWLLFGCSPNKPDLESVFVDGASCTATGQKVTIQIIPLGQVEFHSGKVAPKDTMVLDVEAELDRSVPTTTGTAEAVAAKFPSGDERIAFLRVLFSTDSAVRYTLAIRRIGPQWHESYREAYPVDSGFGGFVDHKDQATVNELLGVENSETLSRLHKELELQSKPTWSWSNFEVKQGMRMLVVSSGFGDGAYKTFYGLNSTDEVVSLITDFNVIQSELSHD